MRVVLISVALLLFVATAARAEEQFFDSDGVKIRYWIEGEGEPVLLIHGYTANGNLNWSAPGIQQALAEKYRVIMPDVRGHGLSDAPPEGQHGIHVVEDMVRLLDQVGAKKAHVVGYSMGGMISIKLATLHPDRVQSLLIGGMGWIQEGSESARNYATSTAESARLQASLRGFGDFATSEEAMKAISAPVKVIIGTDDNLTRRVDLWKTIVPDLDVLYVDGATHQGCVFKPELKQGILDFVAANSGK